MSSPRPTIWYSFTFLLESKQIKGFAQGRTKPKHGFYSSLKLEVSSSKPQGGHWEAIALLIRERQWEMKEEDDTISPSLSVMSQISLRGAWTVAGVSVTCLKPHLSSASSDCCPWEGGSLLYTKRGTVGILSARQGPQTQDSLIFQTLIKMKMHYFISSSLQLNGKKLFLFPFYTWGN